MVFLNVSTDALARFLYLHFILFIGGSSRSGIHRLSLLFTLYTSNRRHAEVSRTTNEYIWISIGRECVIYVVRSGIYRYNKPGEASQVE